MIKVTPATEPQSSIPHTSPKKRCAHSRLVDGVLSTTGTHTGQLLCLECMAQFPDPTFQQPVH